MEKIKKIKKLKDILIKEGFIIEGIVGSFARGENFNDIDIIYSVNNVFLEKYGGFRSVIRLEKIKSILQKELGIKVNLIAKNAMSKTAKKYMNKDFVNV